MIQFSDTATDPKAMMIILPDTSLTLPAMFRSIWLLQTAIFAEPLFRQFNLRYILNRLHHCLLLSLNLDTRLHLDTLILVTAIYCVSLALNVFDIAKFIVLAVDEEFGLFSARLRRLGLVDEARVDARLKEQEDRETVDQRVYQRVQEGGAVSQLVRVHYY